MDLLNKVSGMLDKGIAKTELLTQLDTLSEKIQGLEQELAKQGKKLPVGSQDLTTVRTMLSGKFDKESAEAAIKQLRERVDVLEKALHS